MRNFFEFQNAAKIVCGESALQTIGKELAYYGASKPMIILSANAVKLGAKAKVEDAVKASGVKNYVLAENSSVGVDIDRAKKEKELYLSENCDSIIAVGGDSEMDDAKVVKLLLSQEWDEILPVVAESEVKKKDIPLIAIPSENGSGKESNGYVEVGEYYLSSPCLIPNVIIIDEDVTMAAPSREVAACGAYALANAIEAYLESEETDVAGIYAEKAIDLLVKNLVKAVGDSANEEACRATALAATLAGVAYGANPYGAAHALAEGVNAATGEPTEEAFGFVLVPAVKHAKPKAIERLKTLYFFLVGAEEYAETPESERGERSIVAIEKMLKDLREIGGIPTKIAETKIQRESFGKIAEAAADKRASITAYGPINKDEFIEMLNEAY